MRSSIIVGVDGTREATDAARVAASLARGLHRRLVLAHVAAGPPLHADRWQREVQRRRAIQRGTDLLEGVATEIGEPTARRRIALSGLIEGDLEDRLAVLTREEDADLVVVGSRARGLPGKQRRVPRGRGPPGLGPSLRRRAPNVVWVNRLRHRRFG